MDFDKNKTLEELENQNWGEPEFGSHLVTTCHHLRRKSLSQFTPEDLRLMIGQKISLSYLLPLALEVLGENPLAGGDLYKGALLQNALGVNPEFWQAHPELRDEINAIVQDLECAIEKISPFIEAFKKGA